jgi:3-oxoadipate enol-lactonase
MPSLPPAIHLEFATAGEGPLVVALHDLGRPGDALLEALRPLADDHRVIVPDLRGHGLSPTPGGPWSIDDFASDVARLVASQGGPAVTVGVGLGAASALALALGHPGLVSGLVLSGLGPRSEDADGRDRWMLLARALRERQENEGAALSAEAMATRPDWRGALSQVEAPVTVLAGEDDRAVPPADQRELSVWIRGSAFRSLPGAGHDLAADAPEELVAAVRRITARHPEAVAA